MQCEEVQLELQSYLHGDLPEQKRATIDDHLATCHACSEEAGAMTELTRRLSRGLRQWVDEGVCPPEVMAKIELAIPAEQQKVTWKRWMWAAGAAAAMLLVVFGTQLRTPGQPATGDLIGARITGPGPTQKDGRIITVDKATEQQGVTMTVTEVEVGSELTLVRYTLAGSNLATDADLTRYTPQLQRGPAGRVKLRKVSALRRKNDVLLEAQFDSVASGDALALSVESFPVPQSWLSALLGRNVQTGPWEVSFNTN